MPKRAREEDELEVNAKKSSRKSLKKMEGMTAPSTLKSVREGEEVLLLRYPASLNLSHLEGLKIPTQLLSSGQGGGLCFESSQGTLRLAVASQDACAQELFVVAVKGKESGEEDGENAEESTTVEFLPTTAALALDVSIIPSVKGVSGVRRVDLVPRQRGPRRIALMK